MTHAGNLDTARKVLGQAPVTEPMHEDWFWQKFYDRNFGAAIEIFDRLLAISYVDAVTIEVLRLNPALDPLRDDPRFQAMLEKHEKRTN